jgi:hypothetical protein
MLVDVGSELFIAQVMKHVRLPTFRNALALPFPVVDKFDPGGIVFDNCVIGNGRRVIVFRWLEGMDGSLLASSILTS